LLAIVAAFEEWRHFLEGAQHPITVYSYHKNLEYFMGARILNRRQARWNLSLFHFNFVIIYHPGNLQGKPDALSRQSYFMPKPGDDSYDQQKTIILKPNHLQIYTLTTIHVTSSPLVQQICDAMPQDFFSHDIRQQLNDYKSFDPKNHLNNFQFKNVLLYYKDLCYVPSGPLCLQVLQARHDLPSVGHFSFNQIMELISRDFWWPKMWKLVKEYINSCDTCSWSKVPRHRPHGLLQPLSIPLVPWTSISLDFITDLPISKSFDSILIIIDRFTKMAHFIPCSKNITGKRNYKTFLE
jgi:hypothetical protein